MQRWTIIAMAVSLGGLCLLLTVLRWQQVAHYVPAEAAPLDLAVVLPAQAGEDAPATRTPTAPAEAKSAESKPAPPLAAALVQPESAAALKPAVVNVNTASAQQLTTLPGIGEVLAGRIVAYRTAHGPFKSLEGLLAVDGIGAGKLAKLKPYATVAAQ